MAAFHSHLPAWSQIDEIAVTETLPESFRNSSVLRTLATIRTIQALIVWVVSSGCLYLTRLQALPICRTQIGGSSAGGARKRTKDTDNGHGMATG
jgi:hypothetical protein